jgi:hypothetical protein
LACTSAAQRSAARRWSVGRQAQGHGGEGIDTMRGVAAPDLLAQQRHLGLQALPGTGAAQLEQRMG